jgi:hypothetical protein
MSSSQKYSKNFMKKEKNMFTSTAPPLKLIKHPQECSADLKNKTSVKMDNVVNTQDPIAPWTM